MTAANACLYVISSSRPPEDTGFVQGYASILIGAVQRLAQFYPLAGECVTVIPMVVKCSLGRAIRHAGATAVNYSVKITCFIWAYRPCSPLLVTRLFFFWAFWDFDLFIESHAFCVSYIRARRTVTR